ncbi:hypothetical protein [Pseudoalteromonas nigrifaciens]|uniref:hypothetical protein n=1 Tax=Pseudoalteromonas nigrifaciens TaxID=28109 RepID=UPI0018696D2F|nr:hypothetical protein [Pseudoalteromonas nigrifaciens]
MLFLRKSLALVMIVSSFFSTATVAADYREEIGFSLLTDANGDFNYKAFEIILNSIFSDDKNHQNLKKFISDNKGNCGDTGCNLIVKSSFCVAEKALISFTDETSIIKVKKFVDGC